MKYCTKCGKELLDEAVVCPGCGCDCGGKTTEVFETDEKSFGWSLLGFFVPVAGLILWLVWKDNLPKKARSAGLGALVSVVVNVGLTILLPIIYFVIFAVAMGSMISGAAF